MLGDYFGPLPRPTKDSRDLRDPEKLGEALQLSQMKQINHVYQMRPYLRWVYDHGDWSQVERYNANPTTLEKYGRPQDLPVTPF